MVPALRRAALVVLVLGHDFARRCPRALQEAYARNGADKANIYVVSEAGYEPQSTARCRPTEDAVAAVVGASIYVRVVGTAERDVAAWTGHLATICKRITDTTPLRPAAAAAAPVATTAVTAGSTATASTVPRVSKVRAPTSPAFTALEVWSAGGATTRAAGGAPKRASAARRANQTREWR